MNSKEITPKLPLTKMKTGEWRKYVMQCLVKHFQHLLEVEKSTFIALREINKLDERVQKLERLHMRRLSTAKRPHKGRRK